MTKTTKPSYGTRLKALDRAIANAFDSSTSEHERALFIGHLLFHAGLSLSGEYLADHQQSAKYALQLTVDRAGRQARLLADVSQA